MSFAIATFVNIIFTCSILQHVNVNNVILRHVGWKDDFTYRTMLCSLFLIHCNTISYIYRERISTVMKSLLYNHFVTKIFYTKIYWYNEEITFFSVRIIFLTMRNVLWIITYRNMYSYKKKFGLIPAIYISSCRIYKKKFCD